MKLLPAMPASHTGVGSSPKCSTSDLNSLFMCWESRRRWPKCMAPALKWETWKKFLPAVFGNGPENGRFSLSLSYMCTYHHCLGINVL